MTGPATPGRRPARPYEPYAYSDLPRDGCAWHRPAGDWPAISGESRVEVAVIGGGFTGLSAALHLALAGVDVAVLEAETPGWGASGRNGGFCCLGGSKLSDAALVRRFGQGSDDALFRAQCAAVDLVAELLETYRIDARTHSSGELYLAHSPRAVAALRAEEAQLARHGTPGRFLTRAELAAAGAAGPGFHAGLHMPHGFALEPGRYAQGLADAATGAGARLYAQSPVTGISGDGDVYRLTTPSGVLEAKRLILATNGYSSDDLPDWMRARYLPVASNILVTRPLTVAERAAQGWTTDLMAFDSRKLLHYFRLMPDGRFLFGMRGGIRATARAQTAMGRATRVDFERMFPEWRTVETAHFWSGLACLSPSRLPYIGPIGGWRNAWAGFAYHGNGVAFGTWTGARLADLALGRPADMPGYLSAPPGRFPLGSLRRAILYPAYAALALADRF